MKIKNILGMILSLAFLFSLTTVACAEYVDWSFYNESKTLSNSEKNYQLYGMPVTELIDASYLYIYSDKLEYDPEQDFAKVTAPKKDGEIMIVMNYYSEEMLDIYVTDEGASLLDDFLDGSYTSMRIRNYSDLSYADITVKEFNELKALIGTVTTVDVTDLAKCDIYQIIGYDATDTFAHICGAIYRFENELYYVDYDSLDNSHFTSDGEFSYRSGTVDMIKLNYDMIIHRVIDNIESRSYYRSTEYEFEYDSSDFDFNKNVSGAFFWVGIIIFGYVLPCIPFIFGMVLPHTKKHGYTKRWYALSVLSVLWMAIVTSILLILFI